MDATLPQWDEPRPERLIARSTIAFILLFWVAQFALLTAQRLIFMPGEDLAFLLPRFLVTLVGVALSFAIAWYHRSLRGRATLYRLVAAIVAALIGSLVHTVSNFMIFDLIMPERNAASDLASYSIAMFQWFWSYAALSGVLMALSYSVELADRERSLAELGRVAHSAQIRALRYQLNPHFMFNTLNSISALILRRENETAEAMVENLADFLRAGLALDPLEDITLAKEIELQSLYLAIEALRFADRLVVEIDVPEDTTAALVPSLVSQPLIENAVRHAVANSTIPITLGIVARRVRDTLTLAITNSAPDDATCTMKGTGVGLSNVSQRLQQRFGARGTLDTRIDADGRFVATIAIPFETRTPQP